MSYIGGLDNEAEIISYIYMTPIISIPGIVFNAYFIIYTPYLEGIYPTGIGYIRFMNIVDLAIGLSSFVWPWLYNFGIAYSHPFSNNIYWIVYMSYFHPPIQATWSKTGAFLLPFFAAERFISVVRRNKFTLLRNIEFVKFTALMCLALGLLLSMPRISWYKVTYMRWYPDPPRLAHTLNSKSFLKLPNSSSFPNTHEPSVRIYGQFYNATFSTSHRSFEQEEDRSARTLYFREIDKHSLYRKSYILENTTEVLAYFVALGLTACNIIFLGIRNEKIKQSKKAINGKTGSHGYELFHGILIKPSNRANVSQLNQNTSVILPNSNDVGHRRMSDLNIQNTRKNFKLADYIVAPLSLLKIYTSFNRNSHKGHPSYAILVIPEKEITLIKVQIWTTVFKFLCLFPLPIMSLLYPKFQKQHAYAMLDEEITNSHGFASSLPYIHFLEFFNAALTPCLMTVLIPEMRTITHSLFYRIFHLRP